MSVATVKLPPEKFATTSKEGGPQEIPTEPKKFILNSGEELYAELRDKNFNAVGATLSKKAKLITAQFDVWNSKILRSVHTWWNLARHRYSHRYEIVFIHNFSKIGPSPI